MSVRRLLNTISKRNYHQVITEHFNKPKNIGTLDKKDPNVGTGLVGSPSCGDVIKLQIKVDENDKIVETKCKIFGCLIGTTIISTLNNEKSVESLQVGDKILAWNGKSIVENEIESIIESYQNENELIILHFESTLPIVCTKNHIFWLSNDKPIEAEDLNIGDQCFLLNKTNIIPETVKLVERNILSSNSTKQIKVYDIKLKEGANVFFAHNVASHNCGSAIANTSFASELIKNKSIEEASQVTNMEIAKATHSNQIKLHCSSLAADAIQAAITDLKQKREKK